MPWKVQQTWYDAIWNMPYEICHMKYAIWNMQYAICCCHNCHKLYAMANGNMLYTIYNVQYVICNLSVSFVKYLSNNSLSSLIFFTFETLPYTFILGYWLKLYGLFVYMSFMRSILSYKIIFVFVENRKTNTANAWISHKKKGTL